ncbi:class I mannose-6-phosphate isomerase [Sinomonas humi]|uniref:Carbohydrate kinase n=1 Tax=Sinomonas humi TaxID=1338436 RepID=A0A0B2AI43_9MICC|nr:class I mannose-6-phosphate isomerase [Sinomonas humi]KHL01496.1 carbohydrate kinase [Sinomonas humi]
MLRPLILGTNRPPARFYAGGMQIDAFRSLPSGPDHTPEDWVASTTAVRGQFPAGLSMLPEGRLLRDAIADDPESWLSAAHVARWGDDAMILVKLLDAGQRLPVHAHPDDAFAAAELASAHGKAEAWFILEPGVVHLGLREDVDRAELAQLVERQDTTALLGLLNEVAVAKNDALVVPPGTLHAIGRSVLLAEVQQPTDLSILLEWDGFDIDGAAEGHLGIGFDRALEAVDTHALEPARLAGLVARGAVKGPVLPAIADAWFRLDRVTRFAAFDAGYAVIIATDGSSMLRSSVGQLALSKGETAVVPASSGPLAVETDGSVLVARPPAP